MPLPCPETDWTRRWERDYRSRWIERDGKLFPVGTKPEQMEPPPPRASYRRWERVDFTGRTIGSVIVLGPSERDDFGRGRWRVRCTLCGRERELRSDVLRAGKGGGGACCQKVLPP